MWNLLQFKIIKSNLGYTGIEKFMNDETNPSHFSIYAFQYVK